jgi:hypothetical protein
MGGALLGPDDVGAIPGRVIGICIGVGWQLRLRCGRLYRVIGE